MHTIFGRLIKLFPFVTLLSGCGENLPGDYPAGREAKEASQISASSFSGASIPCSNKLDIAKSLFQKTIDPILNTGADLDPKLINYGVDDVQLIDGKGRAAAIQYSIKPGEPLGLAIITIHFYLNGHCQLSNYQRTESYRKLAI